MLRKNIFKALALAGCFVTVFAQADSGTGTVKVTALGAMTFTEDNELHFGEVPTADGSTCTMSSTGAVSGDCTDHGGNQQIGQITVTGVVESSSVTITITGDNDEAGIDFVAAAEIEMNSGNSGAEATLADGVASGSLTVTADDIVATVYGTLDVEETLTAGTEYTTSYTLDVSYL